jgi:hypothetical protein
MLGERRHQLRALATVSSRPIAANAASMLALGSGRRSLLLAVALGLGVSCRIALAGTVDRGWHRAAAKSGRESRPQGMIISSQDFRATSGENLKLDTQFRGRLSTQSSRSRGAAAWGADAPYAIAGRSAVPHEAREHGA